LRTTVPPLEVEPAARAALASLDPAASMSQIRTGEGLSAELMAPARFMTVLMGSFAALALLLTVAGLYGLLSYMVVRRRREIGVRAALGAGRGNVIAMVWRRAALLLTMGLVAGSAGAFGVGRLLTSLVDGIPSHLPTFVAIACGVMAIAGSVASLVPAGQASSVNPIEALRSE
ncbi:MAG: FtsX-like permease family protein, partial [Vicinamibacterales bacterium]